MKKKMLKNPGEGQAPATTEDLDPKLLRQSESLIAGLMKLTHSKETRDQVMELLQSGDPIQAVPATANMIYQQLEGMSKKAVEVDNEVKLTAMSVLVSDLLDLGTSAGVFQISEEQVGPILEASIQQYIQRGIEEGTIDPVELQAQVEQLMPPEQRQKGLELAGKTGVPQAATREMAMDRIITQEREPLMQENAKLKSLLQQGQMQGQGQGQPMQQGQPMMQRGQR
jgi:hypothetical protein